MHFKCLDNPSGQTVDFVLVTVPWTDSSMPLMAPAALKPMIERAGLSCMAVDLNVEVFHYTRSHPLKDNLVQFFFDEHADQETIPVLRDIFLSIAEQILSFRPRYVGLSLFSYVCQHSAKWLAYYIKRLDPTVTIVVGGAGCLNTFTGASPYIEQMLELKLFDYHIRGDGEYTLYDFLKGHTQKLGINTLEWQEMSKEELRALPLPDYENYHFDIYDKKILPLIGSRGCVRQCKFCDYIANWKKFQWRTAEDIFDEMITQYQHYKISTFKFQDSLTNGNQKEFYTLTKKLAEYNENNPREKFNWSGYFIFRDVTSTSEEEWQLIAKSGAANLMVGIENFNEHIRYDIGKKFSNKSIDFHLAQAKKHGIQLQLLNIVGYVNETYADIEFAKQWLRDHVEYRDILHIQWGGTLGIFPNTYLDKHKDQLGIQMIGSQPSLWINQTTGSTPSLRARWATELNSLSKELGYRVFDNIDNHYLLETLIHV